MSIRRLPLLLVLMVLSACAGGQTGEGSGLHLPIPHIDLSFLGIGAKAQPGHLEKATYDDQPILLWGDTSLGANCVPQGETKLEAATPPLHGAVQVKPGRLYAVFPEGHPRAYCSGRLVTGLLAYYTPEKGFSGVDQVVLRAATADGDKQVVTVDITVSPRPGRVIRRRPAAAAPAQGQAEQPDQPLPTPKPTIRDPNAPVPEVLPTPYPHE